VRVDSGQALTELSASRLAELIRSRQVSPMEVVDAHLERIQAVNRDLNAIVTLRADEAREEARRLERLVRLKQAGPLCGVPFTVKDTIATAGVRTTCGSRTMANFVPTYDASAVGRLKGSGAILLGKTNSPEFGLGIHTWNALFGETKSPFPGFGPGGSSGGESVAVAAGCSPLGLGTDFGGSVRWPAHCTGIVGLRPTVGRVAGTGQLPGTRGVQPAIPNAVTLQGRLQVVGPLTRTVEDVELALKIIAGPDGIDPAAVPVGLPTYTDVRSMPVAWCGAGGPDPPHAQVLTAVERAAAAVREAGAVVEQSRPTSLEHAAHLFTQLRDLDGVDDLLPALEAGPELATRPIRRMLHKAELGARDLARAAQLWARRNVLRAEMLRFLDQHAVLLMPVAAGPAPPVSRTAPEVSLEKWDLVQPSREISLFGLPAIAVRASTTDEGLPVAVQVVGRPFREDEIIAVARVIENSCAR
jgi:amidase